MHKHAWLLCPHDRGLVDYALSDKVDRLCELTVARGVAVAAAAKAEAAEADASKDAAAYFGLTDETSTRGFDDQEQNAASLYELEVPEADVIVSTVVSTSTASVSAATLTSSSTDLAAAALNNAAKPDTNVTPDAESSSFTAAALTKETLTRGFDDQEQNTASLHEFEVPETNTEQDVPSNNTEQDAHVNSDLANVASLHEFEVPEADVIISTVVSTSTASVSAATLIYSFTDLVAAALTNAAEPDTKVTADAESSSFTAAALTKETLTRGFDDQEQNTASLHEFEVPKMVHAQEAVSCGELNPHYPKRAKSEPGATDESTQDNPKRVLRRSSAGRSTRDATH
jgi:hypothetical protein